MRRHDAICGFGSKECAGTDGGVDLIQGRSERDAFENQLLEHSQTGSDLDTFFESPSMKRV
eukprot:CAMPEP_0175085672 /NCGR_PEP_ID=MMETSP0052_2-20121109/28801_1 /TAXON_ID=51329 ORGANISM="Polytomella parva, Strain SAG 63-3" /NCGR_SAMPLE_ID=MMETSP0052_2 /ASSEMBLY_ACC=CAM_ASM_000194 /LENGTH=60 /DNA_ID=CAMNT_0016357725 /DNA_START=20 /DNA_END=199 /DNA_ORIENTATION=+